MALTTKRIIALPSQTDPQEGDYLAIDNAQGGTHKIPVGRIGVEVDDTLTEQGKAADAKAVGDALDEIRSQAEATDDAIDEIRSQIEVTGTASGAIATFADADEAPLVKCLVDINPIQDLHGYDHPWVGGGGKNKLDQSAYTSLDATSYSNGVFTAETLSAFNSAMVRLYKNGAVADTINKAPTEGSRVSINVTVDDTWDDCFIGYRMGGANNIGGLFNKPNVADGTYTVSFMADKLPSTSVYGKFSNIQFESGSTATSYEPYENICPISGWSSADVNVAGENLCSDLEQGYWAFANGSGGSGNQAWVRTPKVECEPNTSYTAKADEKYTRYQGFVYWDADGTFISSRSSERDALIDYTATTPANAHYMAFNIAEERYEAKIQPSDVSRFGIYKTDELTTTTTPLGRTVYGATLDIVSGLLTVTHGIRALDGTEQYADDWNLSATNRIGVYIDGSRTSEYDAFECSHYKPTLYRSLADGGISKAQGGNTAYIIKDSAHCVTDVATYKAYVAEQYANGTPITLCYELATPQTYTLTGQEISTLLGDNNVWADSGDVEVVYVRDLNIAINNLLNNSGTRSLGMMAMSAPTEATADEPTDEPAEDDMR